MGLLANATGISTDITPIFNFNAVNGRAKIVDRVQTATGWTNQETDIPIPVKFVADFPTMTVGPMNFVGNRPDFHLVKMADVVTKRVTVPDAPTPEHRKGFVVLIYSKSMGLRAWRSQARCVLSAMDAIYDAYHGAPQAKEGLVPVLEITGVTPIKRDGAYPRTDMQPVIKIAQWVQRPDAFKEKEKAQAGLEAADDDGAAGDDAEPLAETVKSEVRRPAGHVRPPAPTPQQIGAAQMMMAPDEDAAEFV
jgi:hypothetical protein